MSKAKVAICLIVVLAVFAGVQTYRAHTLAGRLASLSSSAGASGAHSREDRASNAEHDAAAAKTPGVAADTDATKHVEALLKQERERARQTQGSASGTRTPAAPEGNANAGEQPGSIAPKTPAAGNTAGPAGNKPANETQKDRSADARSAMSGAQAAMEKGAYDDAIAILKQGLEADPTNRDLYRFLGGIYGTLGQHDAEFQAYAALSAQYPEEAMPHYDEARALAALGRNADAIQELARFQQLSKDNMNMYPMAASIYRSMGMSAEEGAVLQAWAQQAPDTVDVRRSLADYYSRTGDTQAALTEYQRLAQLLPEDADTRRSLAGLYRRLNMNEEAESELAAAVDLQPRNLMTRLQLADLYRQEQQFDAALQTYSAVAVESPSSPEGQQAQRMIVQIQHQLQPATPSPR